MKMVIPLAMILVLAGCASRPQVRKKVDPNEVKAEDFKKPVQVLYKDDVDTFGKVGEASSMATNDESLQRLDEPDDIKVNSVLDEIIVACYQKKFEQAFSLIQTHHDQYKEHPIFWNQVGTCYMLQGNRRKALLFYNKALEYKTSYAPAYNNLGVMYRLEGDDAKALVAFTRSKKSNNFAKSPRFNLAQLYLEYGLYNQAISILKPLESMAPNDVDIVAGLATAYLMKGETKNSISYFQKIDNDFWERPHIGINYAYASYLDGDKKMALKIIDDLKVDDLGIWTSYYHQVISKIGVK